MCMNHSHPNTHTHTYFCMYESLTPKHTHTHTQTTKIETQTLNKQACTSTQTHTHTYVCVFMTMEEERGETPQRQTTEKIIKRGKKKEREERSRFTFGHCVWVMTAPKERHRGEGRERRSRPHDVPQPLHTLPHGRSFFI